MHYAAASSCGPVSPLHYAAKCWRVPSRNEGSPLKRGLGRVSSRCHPCTTSQLSRPHRTASPLHYACGRRAPPRSVTVALGLAWLARKCHRCTRSAQGATVTLALCFEGCASARPAGLPDWPCIQGMRHRCTRYGRVRHPCTRWQGAGSLDDRPGPSLVTARGPPKLSLRAMGESGTIPANRPLNLGGILRKLPAHACRGSGH